MVDDGAFDCGATITRLIKMHFTPEQIVEHERIVSQQADVHSA